MADIPGRTTTLVYDCILPNTAAVAVFSRNTWLSITTVFFRVVYGEIRPFVGTSE
jgi:hypothetical protein